jgi:hypothetical protein
MGTRTEVCRQSCAAPLGRRLWLDPFEGQNRLLSDSRIRITAGISYLGESHSRRRSDPAQRQQRGCSDEFLPILEQMHQWYDRSTGCRTQIRDSRGSMRAIFGPTAPEFVGEDLPGWLVIGLHRENSPCRCDASLRRSVVQGLDQCRHCRLVANQPEGFGAGDFEARVRTIEGRAQTRDRACGLLAHLTQRSGGMGLDPGILVLEPPNGQVNGADGVGADVRIGGDDRLSDQRFVILRQAADERDRRLSCRAAGAQRVDQTRDRGPRSRGQLRLRGPTLCLARLLD